MRRVSAHGPDPALASLARHAEAVATVRTFGRASGAARVVLVLDRGEAPPVLLELDAGEPLRLTEAEVTHEIPAALPAGRPLELADVRPPPASAVFLDPLLGELSAPIGAIANLAEAVLSLAGAFGGRSVATADFPTRDPGQLLTIAARPGEPVVLAVGDQQFAMPGGWPETA